MPEGSHFSALHLKKKHREKFHPDLEKSFKSIGKSCQEHATKRMRQAVENVRSVLIFSADSKRTSRFRVSFGAENCRFNEELVIENIYFSGTSVLQNINEGRHFSFAKLVQNILANTSRKNILDS